MAQSFFSVIFPPFSIGSFYCLVGGWYNVLLAELFCVRAIITICHQAKNNMLLLLVYCCIFALIFHFIHKSPSKPLLLYQSVKNQVYHIVQGNLLLNYSFSFFK